MTNQITASNTSQNSEVQFIAAITSQQERIAHLENQITQMIQSQRANNAIVTSLKPPKPEYFDGDNVDTFLFGLEKIFAFYNIPNENKVQLAVTYFRGPALRWYRYIESQSSNAAVINDWQLFTGMLKRHFQSANTEITVRNKLNSLRQLGAVSKYNDLFNSLIIELLDVDEKTKLDMYCRGLKSNIQLQVMLKAPKSLEDAQITALNVDHILNSNNFGLQRRSYQNHNSSNSTVNQPILMDLGNIDGENHSDDANLAEQLHAINTNVRKLLNRLSNEDMAKK